MNFSPPSYTLGDLKSDFWQMSYAFNDMLISATPGERMIFIIALIVLICQVMGVFNRRPHVSVDEEHEALEKMFEPRVREAWELITEARNVLFRVDKYWKKSQMEDLLNKAESLLKKARQVLNKAHPH